MNRAQVELRLEWIKQQQRQIKRDREELNSIEGGA